MVMLVHVSLQPTNRDGGGKRAGLLSAANMSPRPVLYTRQRQAAVEALIAWAALRWLLDDQRSLSWDELNNTERPP